MLYTLFICVYLNLGECSEVFGVKHLSIEECLFIGQRLEEKHPNNVKTVCRIQESI